MRAEAITGLEAWRLWAGLHQLGLVTLEQLGPVGRGVATDVGVGAARRQVGSGGGAGIGLGRVTPYGPLVRLVARHEDVIFCYQEDDTVGTLLPTAE